MDPLSSLLTIYSGVQVERILLTRVPFEGQTLSNRCHDFRLLRLGNPEGLSTNS